MIIIAGWCPYLFANYPGTVCPDAIAQLSMYYGIADYWDAWQPPLSTWIMGSIADLGRYIFDMNLGIFFYILIQTIISALSYSYSAKKIKELGFCRGWWAAIFFFGFTPFFGLSAQWYEKSFLYTAIVTFQLVLMMEIMKEKSCDFRQMLLLIVTGVLSSLIRKNGIYATVPTIIAMSVFIRGISRKRIILALIATVLTCCIVNHYVYPAMGIHSDNVREALNIPFQQTARCVRNSEKGIYGDNKIPENEVSEIGRFLNYEVLNNGYRPKLSDPVKWTYDGDTKKLPQYFLLWVRMGFRYPGTYIAAFINQCCGYIAPVSANIELSEPQDEYLYELGITHPHGQKNEDIIRCFAEACISLPIIKYLFMPGLFTWVTIICVITLFQRKLYATLVLWMPSVITIIVCIAGPSAFYIRYEMPIISTMPLMFAYTKYSILNLTKE